MYHLHAKLKLSLVEALIKKDLPLASGGDKGADGAVQVEKLLQHPDGAAGAQTAHDDEREQPAFPAA